MRFEKLIELSVDQRGSFRCICTIVRRANRMLIVAPVLNINKTHAAISSYIKLSITENSLRISRISYE
ncbi:hypothetical protein D7209_31835 [Burkholderia cepacia]|nr:hypothetical protein [Burkholderia cepacia]MBB0081222.1 hypothetical protein [Burkholderia cepacia]MBB0124368.1 hypothetical protein [Burkholderia cepacia]